MNSSLQALITSSMEVTLKKNTFSINFINEVGDLWLIQKIS